jgi:hypothetical protein
MIRTTRRTVPLARRLARPGVLVLLVLAQGATAFGFPLVRSCVGPGGCQGRACGCGTTGVHDGCCCGGGSYALPAPEPESCLKCRAKNAKTEATDPNPTVKWLLGWNVRQCRGDGPLGLTADVPAVPPALPARPAFTLDPAGVVLVTDARHPLHFSDPLDPPPRRGSTPLTW